jgi:hypothetical protein
MGMETAEGNRWTELSRLVTYLRSSLRVPRRADMTLTMTDIEKEFDTAMMGIYHRAKYEADYNATRYLRMLRDHGGVQTAKILLHASNVSDGYTALWERKRLDLTVEALILEEKWSSLFSDAEREIGRNRLRAYNYEFGER